MRSTIRGGAQREALALCLAGTAVGLAMEVQAGFRRLKATGNCCISEGHSPINAGANVRTSPRTCRMATSCFGPIPD
jgi:hypothetical protein